MPKSGESDSGASSKGPITRGLDQSELNHAQPNDVMQKSIPTTEISVVTSSSPHLIPPRWPPLIPKPRPRWFHRRSDSRLKNGRPSFRRLLNPCRRCRRCHALRTPQPACGQARRCAPCQSSSSCAGKVLFALQYRCSLHSRRCRGGVCFDTRLAPFRKSASLERIGGSMRAPEHLRERKWRPELLRWHSQCYSAGSCPSSCSNSC